MPEDDFQERKKESVLLACNRTFLLYALLLLAGFTLLRGLLLARQWPQISHAPASLLYIFLVGLVYDLAFIVYLSLFLSVGRLVLPEPFRRSRFNQRFLAPLIFFLLIYGFYFTLVAEWLFWDEFRVRFNFIAIDYLVYCHEVTLNIYQSYPLVSLLTGILLASLLTYAGFAKFRLQDRRGVVCGSWSNRALATLLLTLTAGLTYCLVGQTLHEHSLNNFSNELAANGPYQFFAAFRDNCLDYRQFYALGRERPLSDRLQAMVVQDNARLRHRNRLYDLDREVINPGPEKRMNVFLITVESLSARYLSRFGERRGITPFMDHWFKEGLLFTNLYATGTRTVRGLEAISLSFPPTPGRSLIKRPEAPRFLSLGELFARRGYDVAFLYGGRGFFDNMNSFFAAHGYRCLDRSDFQAEEVSFSNAWGVCDEDLLNKALAEADRDSRRNRPFFFQLMTTSNHKPFTYPDHRIDIPSGHGRSGGVKYTDYALKKFIARARTRPWFANTIFVVVADHCAHSAGRSGLPVSRYHIPLFFYAPGLINPAENDLLGSQIDLGPTLLGLLHFSYRCAFFGRDLMRADTSLRPRALLANYVKLGLLEDDRLTVLAIHRKISRQDKPYTKSFSVRVPDNLVRDCQAYYQGADYIIRNGVNAEP